MYFADSLSSVVNPEWFISDLDPKQIAPDPGKKAPYPDSQHLVEGTHLF